MKTEIWNKAFGDKFYGNCFCCNKKIQANWCSNNSHELQFGHIIPFSICRENKWDNLVPICKGCNGSMSNTHMIVWIKEHYPSNIKNFNDKLKLYVQS